MKTSASAATPKILVTGASGQSGSLVINECIRQGIAVRALVRNPDKAAAFKGAATVEMLAGDMLKPETLMPALQGVERALLISSSNEVMVDTQCTFIDTCRKAGVPHVIKFSGEECQTGYDFRNFRFTKEHRQIETHLEHSGLQWTHLCPSQFMQVYLREAGSVRNKGALFLSLEDISMSPVDLEDVAKIAVALLQQGGHQSERLRITGPAALTMSQIAAIITSVINKPVNYVKVSQEARNQLLLNAGVPLYLVEAIAAQSEERRRHPDAFVDLSTHQRFNIKPSHFEAFALRHAAVFGLS
ncbi:NmrA family NAD(P)-binding protein [Chitinophaga sp. 22321]|uniref:NmrA family NAD(P)-binding protein n=1 Tax=Chitinophaga hostae TaxID=2831022 RepID=A0ABS5J5S1_9BACT|nr:NmrA family NAD(P)-binding protein [Chitinophaga hostae]MBS0030415.1 NmrA family NAD(P)-binding protein [Chitinophaga hostae]